MSLRKALVAFFVVIGGISFGQTVPRFAQVNFGQGIYNPAALSIDAKTQVDAFIRQQWTGFKGIPATGVIQGSHEFYEDMAAGAVISYDNIGHSHSFQFQAQYAYKIIFENTNMLNVGLSAGFESKTIDLRGSTIVDQDDPAFRETYYNKFGFQAGFGLYFNTPNFYIGVGLPQLFQNNLFGPNKTIQPTQWNYFLSTGGYINNGGSYTFNPHLQVKAAINAPFQASLILRNSFSGTWSFVVGYRTENALIAGVDFQIGGRYRIGYSFGYGIGKSGRELGVSNEVFLSVGLPYYRRTGDDFSKGKYYNKKGRHKRDFRKGYKRRSWWK